MCPSGQRIDRGSAEIGTTGRNRAVFRRRRLAYGIRHEQIELLAVDSVSATECDVEGGYWLAREIKKRVGGDGRLIIEQNRGPRILMLGGFDGGCITAWWTSNFNNVRLSKIGKLQPVGLRNATFDHDTLPQYTLQNAVRQPRASRRSGRICLADQS